LELGLSGRTNQKLIDNSLGEEFNAELRMDGKRLYFFNLKMVAWIVDSVQS